MAQRPGGNPAYKSWQEVQIVDGVALLNPGTTITLSMGRPNEGHILEARCKYTKTHY